MGRIWIRSIAVLLLLPAAVVPAATQTSTRPTTQGAATPANQAAAPKTPDMVCWGNDPSWSIQFASWGARYVGINQPDQDFPGSFHWMPEDKDWVWQRAASLPPVSGYSLSAVIKEASCMDPVRKEKYPYSAQVSLLQGDTVSGCCRKLKAEDAPVGPQGAPQ